MTRPDNLTPAKALRTLIDIERKERARAERRARIRARISRAIERLNPFRREEQS